MRIIQRVFCLGAVLVTTASSAATEFYVAPGGSDTNPGTQSQPFATIPRAQQAVRNAQKSEPMTVYLRGGTYFLNKPVLFTPADSGTQKAIVTYAAYVNEKPVINGGRKIDLVWNPYKNNILQAQVPVGLVIDALYADGQRQPMARFPNFDPNAKPFHGTDEDCFALQRTKNWADPAGGFIHALHKSRWGGHHYLITGKDAKGQITFEGGWQNNRGTAMHPKYRMVENVFEELDDPGEWFCNRKTGTLYYWPGPNIDPKTARFEISNLENIFRIEGTRKQPVCFIDFQGLAFCHTTRTFMKTIEPLLRSDWTINRQGALFLTDAQDCNIVDCDFTAFGGNGIFVSDYARRIHITGCHLFDGGANGICFVGDPQSVRSPNFEYHETTPVDQLDRIPGPKTDDYPADCRVEDCLIHEIGYIEKQVTGVQIAMAQSIQISHCSIYDVPRAGINIGDGCWGGHVIEFCDVFHTVLETGDHGSFNSWGRDRFWYPDRSISQQLRDTDPRSPEWDCVKTTVIRNSRWRCDHGWDIDLDDGSTNYHLYNNLCLNGGIKLREGFDRTVENNITVNNTFHPHVWFRNSGDTVQQNIFMAGYRPARMNAESWSQAVDKNLFTNQSALDQVHGYGVDAHSIAGDPLFVDPVHGDFRVRDGSPALTIGFENFPMDQFGVQSARLKSIVMMPEIPEWTLDAPVSQRAKMTKKTRWLGATIRNLSGLNDLSATGLGNESGILLESVRNRSQAAMFGFRTGDVILAIGDDRVADVRSLIGKYKAVPTDQQIKLIVWRNQAKTTLTIDKNVSRP